MVEEGEFLLALDMSVPMEQNPWDPMQLRMIKMFISTLFPFLNGLQKNLQIHSKIHNLLVKDG